jgi:hypothetical protein
MDLLTPAEIDAMTSPLWDAVSKYVAYAHGPNRRIGLVGGAGVVSVFEVGHYSGWRFNIIACRVWNGREWVGANVETIPENATQAEAEIQMRRMHEKAMGKSTR